MVAWNPLDPDFDDNPWDPELAARYPDPTAGSPGDLYDPGEFPEERRPDE